MYHWWVSCVSVHLARKDFRGDRRPEKWRETTHMKLFITPSLYYREWANCCVQKGIGTFPLKQLVFITAALVCIQMVQ